MSEIFEVKRSKMFYEYCGCQCETTDDVVSFRGVVTNLVGEDDTAKKDVVIGFFDYNSNSYYWFYENFDEIYLTKLEGFNYFGSSLDELEEAMSESTDGDFKLTHVAHDYSLFIQKG